MVVLPLRPEDADEAAPRVAALDLELWDAPALGMAPATLAALGLEGARSAVIHVPIDPRAVAEARGCLRAPPPETSRGEPGPPPETGWITRAARAERVGPVLIEAALRAEVDPVEDRTARLVLGRRPVRATGDVGA